MTERDAYDVTEVFTPTTPAIRTFVERESINVKLVDAIRTPGKQIVVYGPTGSGKSTLLVNKLLQLYENQVITRCTSTTTFDQILLDAFDQLEKYYVSETETAHSSKIDSGISGSYLGIRASLSSQLSSISSKKRTPVIPPQLTPRRLGQFLGESHCCWVLDDFHKIQPTEKEKLSGIMKMFMDLSFDYPKTKIIAIGAVGTAREVVQYDKEMKNRVTEIEVPLMERREILSILEKAEPLLRVKFSSKIKSQIVRYANGLASVCHQLALNMCFDSGISETLKTRYTFTLDEFQRALSRYIENESDSIKSVFEKALARKRSRRFDNCSLILRALALDDQDEGMTHAEILAVIRKQHPDFPAGNITRYLRELQDSDRGSVITYNNNSKHYSFENPFHKAFARAILSSKISNEDYRVETARLLLSELVDEWIAKSSKQMLTDSG